MEQNKEVKLTDKQNRLMALKYFLFSVSAGVIEIAVCAFLNEFTHIDQHTHIDEFFGSNEYGLTYFIGLFMSVLWNFTLNRKFTFKSAANVPIAMLKVLGFYVVFAPASVWWTVRLTNIGWNEYIVLAGTMVINFITEFLFWRFVVYKNQIYTNKDGQRELRENGQLSDDK